MSQDVSLPFLSELNEAQRAAVVHPSGPAMVIAGAGSGKTRVLTYRIAWLMQAKGVDPFNILALTFTNKASREMRDRIERVVGSEARSLWMGTFHSVFARILRSDGHHLGYPSNFSIYDTDDSRTLLRKIIKEMGLDDKTYKANSVHNRISGAKNRLISAKEYQNNPILQADDEAAMKPRIGEIYMKYQERMRKSDAMDFDDLLFNTNVLFRDHADVLYKYQQRFGYVLVDEFQDTNLSQYLITRKLAAVHQNITVVGDDAQSIYAFRGADIQNILNFEKDYPDLTTYKLEQNYRSTKNIVQAANSIIAKNRAQLPKDVWTGNPDGDRIELLKANSDNEEGRLVATSIFEEKGNKHLRYQDFAILYRTNSQSRAFEESLRKLNIPYRIFGGLSFYQRREIKDLMGYLRFTVNPSDEASLRRIINTPKRGIGDSTVDRILVSAFDHGISPWEVVQNAEAFLPGRSAGAVKKFALMMERFRTELEKKDAYDVANQVARDSGLLKELYEDRTVEGLNRYENVQELLNAVKEFVDEPEREDKSLGAFLQDVALLTDADNEEDGPKDYVTLMTIHSAKGLEFPYVYVVGLEDDLFPSFMMQASRNDLEEERRLFYVAITRAERRLFFSYALSRYQYGRLKQCDPSRFLEEVDPRYIFVNQKYGSKEPASLGSSHHYAKNLAGAIQKKPKSAYQKVGSYKVPEDFQPSDTSGLQEGMKVEHPKFGFGRVVSMDVQGANRKAKVLFEEVGEKTLLLAFAKLRIH